mmetsp:Transcript_38859/g.101657  ORF Transcript_38859/g.101657 Transcript_38859/m.101657 type:complete len:104 (-) Transcript_38859:479-790(-)
MLCCFKGRTQADYQPAKCDRSRSGSDAFKNRALFQGRELSLSDFELFATVGKGSFGRVRAARLQMAGDSGVVALKILKKVDLVRCGAAGLCVSGIRFQSSSGC